MKRALGLCDEYVNVASKQAHISDMIASKTFVPIYILVFSRRYATVSSDTNVTSNYPFTLSTAMQMHSVIDIATVRGFEDTMLTNFLMKNI